MKPHLFKSCCAMVALIAFGAVPLGHSLYPVLMLLSILAGIYIGITTAKAELWDEYKEARRREEDREDDSGVGQGGIS